MPTEFYMEHVKGWDLLRT